MNAFEALFADTVQGSGNSVFSRGPEHPDFLPTDDQAEILVPDQVRRQDVTGIAVKDEAQAKREVVALQLLKCEVPPIFIVPEFFEPVRLSNLLRAGEFPSERKYQGGTTDAG